MFKAVRSMTVLRFNNFFSGDGYLKKTLTLTQTDSLYANLIKRVLKSNVK